VALSVDGLSTINAQHTDPRDAPKWVLDPYESMTISGWQVDDGHARQFYFTTEDQSYGAKLGKTQNLGLISAAFFKERRPVVYREVPPPRNPYPPIPPYPPYPPYPPRPCPLPFCAELNDGEYKMGSSGLGMGGLGGGGMMGGGGSGMSAASPAAEASSAKRSSSKPQVDSDSIRPTPSKPDYAATGIGSRVSHEVERVHLDLEDGPFDTVELRYEFRQALLKLGVLPSPSDDRDPLYRREKSKGFKDGEYCPEP